jgi:hypothetical protein
MNLTAGGLFGYCSSKCITSRKVPSSKGVSAGPMMTAFLLGVSHGSAVALSSPRYSYQVMILSVMGEADTPAGGSVCIRWEICQPCSR